jgi:PAS domain S-box-containing protein
MSGFLKAALFDQDNLYRIIDSSYDGMMVTDKQGKIILANPAAATYMEQTREEIIGMYVQDMLKKGAYNRSTALEATEKRKVLTGLVKIKSGTKVLSTSIPLFDKAGEVVMVLTNTRSKDLMDSYIVAIEQERDNADRYKSAAAYLGRLDFLHDAPVAESGAMRQVLSTAKMIAKSDSTVLILGESGTGKEVVSRYIHQNSSRAKEPFIPVNCAAIPHELLESEFFGYERGAFSGASSRGKPGLFEIADKGTLFLDELAELPLLLQSKLLRVLETGEFQRLGATSLRRTNVRFIAATNKDLKQLVNEKKFREDLYYRLNVIPLALPPLRARPEDIRALAQRFLDGLNRKYQARKFLSPRTMRTFLSYNWPGNVRELRNVIERLVITSPNNELDFEEEAGANTEVSCAGAALINQKPTYRGELKKVVQEVEKQYIDQVLQECGGRISEAARRLGIHRTMLYRKIEKTNNSENLNNGVD